jgi:hypothetical protein
MTTRTTNEMGLPLQAGDTVTHRGISVTPLFPTTDPAAQYVSLATAAAQGFTVKEVDDDGSVGELLVTNPTPHRVLLYDGEEVLGAKQNRIINMAVLVEAGATLDVPVSCVEAGRWNWQTDEFTRAGRAPSPDVRRAKAEHMREAPTRRGVAQSAVWDAVELKEMQHGFSSPTSSHGDLIEQQRPQIEELARAFAPQPGQCGMVLGMDGRISCMDAVSRPDVWADLHQALLTGYMLDALPAVGRAPAPDGAVGEFLAAVAGATRTSGPAAGLGTDLRLAGDRVVGSGLDLGGELLQVTAFVSDGTGDDGLEVSISVSPPRIARPSRRRV